VGLGFKFSYALFLEQANELNISVKQQPPPKKAGH